MQRERHFPASRHYGEAPTLDVLRLGGLLGVTMTAEAILALMMLLAKPGHTVHSNTPVVEDARPVVWDTERRHYRELADDEAEPNQCRQGGNPACRRPRYSKARKAWLRTETWREALPRWYRIARAVASVSGDNETLARVLIVTGHHESGGWWTSVHGGYCHRPYQRSCKWEDAGRAWSLWQRLSTRHPGTVIVGTDWTSADIVGEDWGSTWRAARVASRAFRGILRRCKGHVAPCTFIAYGGNVDSDDPRIRARVASWRRLSRVKVPRLDVAAREVLGLED